MVPADLILSKENVRLSILKPEHFSALEKLARDKTIWQYNLSFNDPALFKTHWFDKALKQMAEKRRVVFVIEYQQQIAGSTSYYQIDELNKNLNIGYTWLGKQFLGKGINQITKYLLLDYAFEQLQFKQVEFSIDVLNKTAMHALEKMQIPKNRIISNHLQRLDGTWRDTVVYQITQAEWIRRNLK